MWKLICKEESGDERWERITEAMEIPGVGCLIQVWTREINSDDSVSISQALTFAPGVMIEERVDVTGRCISSRSLISMYSIPSIEEPIVIPDWQTTIKTDGSR